MKPKISFNPTYYQKVYHQYGAKLKKIAQHTFDYLQLNEMKQVYFDVSFITSKQMQSINATYRKKDYVTDVISFALWDEGIKTPLLGEMFICIPKVKEQAKMYQHSFERELSFLFLHGLLHLLGYDHQTEEQEKIMFGLQQEILKSLGIERS